MVNVVCTKYGTLYDSSFVNKLYESLKKHSTIDFKFFCQTEDPSNIFPEIEILPLKVSHSDNKRYHKITLLENTTLVGSCISFDIDIIINNNIDHYLTHNSDRLTLLFSYYRDLQKMAEINAQRQVYKNAPVNSSVFTWVAGSKSVETIVKKHYQTDHQTYKDSFDRFLFWECSPEISLFKFNDYTSYHINGYDPKNIFCIFNTIKDKSVVKNFW